MDPQTPITPPVYAPNLHLFAFHLWRGLTGEPDSLAPKPKHLWEKGDEILQALGFSERLDIFGYPNNPTEPPGAQINLHPEKQLKLAGKLPNSDLTITGLLFAHRLYDSYSLTINLRRPKKEEGKKTATVPISFWQNLNTDRLIFLPHVIESSLGQTLLLTAFLPEFKSEQSGESLEDVKESFARNCVKQLVPSHRNRPPLCQKGELFGSPIFEFGGQILDANLDDEPEVQPHILIFLFRPELLSSGKFENAYRQFIDLFYYRNKVISAYRETRILYRKTYKVYTDLEKKVKSFKQELTQNTTRLSLNQAQLEDLKTVLKELAALDLEYGRLLRNYKHCRNTISINTKNYQLTLQVIFNTLQERNYHLEPEELDFLRVFSDHNSDYFQTRIGDELNYFVEGSNLANKAIASIRGIVEIEQTQRDRTLQEQNEKLENKIAIVGVGIGVGAIVASTSTLIFQPEPMTFPWQEQHGNRPHSFILAFLLSFAIAVVASLVTSGLIKCSQTMRSDKSQEVKGNKQ